MSLRICFVTPFSWSQPNDVNEHVRGAAEALRRRGHTVTVVAPSSRAADLLEGRRALQRGVVGDVVAIGAAVPTSLTERVALPMGVRANLAPTLTIGDFDVVHGFEPGLPSLSSAALLEAETTTAATFFSTERIAVPPRKNQRAKFLARVDALLGTSDEAIERASERFPGDYQAIPLGVDTERFAPSAKQKLIVVELAPGQSAIARAVLRLLPTLPGWEVAARAHRAAHPPSVDPGLGARPRPHEVAREARRAPGDPRRGGRLRAGPGRQRPAPARGFGVRAARSPIRPASPTSPSSPRRRSRGSPRTTPSAPARAKKPALRPRRRDFDQLGRRSSKRSTAR